MFCAGKGNEKLSHRQTVRNNSCGFVTICRYFTFFQSLFLGTCNLFAMFFL